jgi:hypothetical protein
LRQSALLITQSRSTTAMKTVNKTIGKVGCYNIGPYVKKFSSCLLEHDLDLLGVVITYCPNIEVIDFSLDNEKLCDYIISVVRGRVKRNYG